jgi:excisionase family DNA binding protein
MDTRAAAARWGVSQASIRRWIREAELPATKNGRGYEVRERDVRRALKMPRRRGRPSGIQRTRRAQWFHRISFPQGALMGLGMASETWRPDLARRWEFYSQLLPDVAEAAAAVEYTAEKIHQAVATAEAYYVPYLPSLLEGPEPESGRGASHPAFADAYSEFANLVWWIRALDERLQHEYRGRPQGLVPALAPGALRDRVQALKLSLESALAEEARFFANFSLHHSTIPYAFNSNARVVAGRLELPIPDRVTAPITSNRNLSYADGRTLSSFADEATAIVVSFMDAVIDAFTEELPDRVRRPPAASPAARPAATEANSSGHRLPRRG